MYLLTSLLSKEENPINNLGERIEGAFFKIYLFTLLIIIVKIILFYAIQKIKSWLYNYGKPKRAAKVDPYAQFKNPKSILGFCIDYNIKDVFGDLGEHREIIQKDTEFVGVAEIKQKLTYYMQHKLLTRENVITLVTYMQNYAPKGNKKYKNDMHYLNSVLKHHNFHYKVLKCFDELLDELAIPRLVEVAKKYQQIKKNTKVKQVVENKNVIDLIKYKTREVKNK